ncbi:testis-expressed protein 47-like [Rhinatrema bivittatum]|uniref:testis-expressed protein 47-like n=1 Tax=Rhinatrema bivittatum TaxID=194408 RepID=UPI001125E0C0|nr:testis-expressed protein 47-like [Rhinatrema bivittatum]
MTVPAPYSVGKRDSLLHSAPSFNRINVLQAQEDSWRGQHRKCVLHRLFYVANVSPELADKRDVTVYYERLFYNFPKSHLGESFTGLLLLYQSCILHILESSSDNLYFILKDLAQMRTRGPNSLLQDIKILVISHNISARLFSQWSFRIINVPMLYLEDTTHEQSLETVLSECLTLLLRMAVYFAKMPKMGRQGPGENLHAIIPDLLVREDVIQYLCKAQDLMTPTQFLQAFNSPLHVTDASANVWPVPGHLFW